MPWKKERKKERLLKQNEKKGEKEMKERKMTKKEGKKKMPKIGKRRETTNQNNWSIGYYWGEFFFFFLSKVGIEKIRKFKRMTKK